VKKMIVYGILILGFIGCTREPPPEVSDYKAPKKYVLEESTVPESVTTVSTPVVLPPTPPPTAKTIAKTLTPPPSAATPLPVKAKSEPTIIGTWEVQELIKHGQPQPKMAGMQMTLTFAEGGSLSMTISNPQMPQPMTMQGTYTFGDGQISLNIKGQPQSGTYQFEGENRVTLDLGEGKMVLSRV